MKKTLEKRLSSLLFGELISLILFVVVSYLINQSSPDLKLYSLYSFWASFFILEFLLLQGVIYWYAKLRHLKKENNSITPTKVVRFLSILKTVNLILIILTIGVFVFDFVKWYDDLPVNGLLLSLFIYLFAILEFINYFYVELTHHKWSEIKKWLIYRQYKQSSLNKDIKRITRNKK